MTVSQCLGVGAVLAAVVACSGAGTIGSEQQAVDQDEAEVSATGSLLAPLVSDAGAGVDGGDGGL